MLSHFCKIIEYLIRVEKIYVPIDIIQLIIQFINLKKYGYLYYYNILIILQIHILLIKQSFDLLKTFLLIFYYMVVGWLV